MDLQICFGLKNAQIRVITRSLSTLDYLGYIVFDPGANKAEIAGAQVISFATRLCLTHPFRHTPVAYGVHIRCSQIFRVLKCFWH